MEEGGGGGGGKRELSVASDTIRQRRTLLSTGSHGQKDKGWGGWCKRRQKGREGEFKRMGLTHLL